MIALLFGLLALLIFLGFPIAFATGISALIVLILLDLPLSVAITQTYTGVDSFTLLAVPYFILAGEIMGAAQVVDQMVDFANALVGRLRGGLGHANVVGEMIFSGVSGSGAADASALGSITIPAMTKQGYGKDFIVALNSTAAVIGPIIPPSIPMILWASLNMQSIGALFLAGVVPGVMIGFGLMAINYVVCVKRGYDFRTERKFSLKNVCLTLYRSFWALVMPLIILGGIVTGLFTATEAGVVAIMYGFFYGALVRRSLKVNRIPKLLLNAATSTAMIFLIVAFGTVFSNLLVRLNFQETATITLLNLTRSPFCATLVIMAFLLFLGCFIDALPIYIMFAPTLHAIGQQLGYDPLHFALVMIVTIQIGGVTPPVGVYLYVSMAIAEITIEEASRVLLPFLGVLIFVTLIMLLVPPTVTWFPKLMGFG